jgi:hypothetical protein
VRRRDAGCKFEEVEARRAECLSYNSSDAFGVGMAPRAGGVIAGRLVVQGRLH